MTDPTGISVKRSMTAQRAKTRVGIEAREVALDHCDRLAAILHRFSPEPADNLGEPIDIEEAIRLV